MKRLLLLATVSLSAAACAPKSVPAKAPAPAVAAAPAATTAETFPTEDAEAAKPIAAPSIEAMVRKAKACPFGDDGFDSDCEAFKAWSEEEDAFAEGKGEAALLKMVESGDPKDRFLAAERLTSINGALTDAHSGDPATIERLLVAFEKEKNVVVAKRFGLVATRLDLASSNKVGRAVAIAKAHPVEEYRTAYLDSAGFFSFNRGEPLLAWGEELVKNGKASDGRVLVSNFTREKQFGERACKTLAVVRKDKDAYVAGEATLDMARAPACRSFDDGILRDIAAVDVGKVGGPKVRSTLGMSLEAMCSDKDLPGALRTRALGQAKRIVDAKTVSSSGRSAALHAVAACDAKTGAAYASKLANDKDLGSAAKYISERSAKK